MRFFFSIIFITTLSVSAQQDTKQIAILVNQLRIESRIQELANDGKDAQGRGYRVGFTRGDIEARTCFVGLEIRDLSYDKTWQLFREIDKRAASIASSSGVQISFRKEPNESRPAMADKELQPILSIDR